MYCLLSSFFKFMDNRVGWGLELIWSFHQKQVFGLKFDICNPVTLHWWRHADTASAYKNNYSAIGCSHLCLLAYFCLSLGKHTVVKQPFLHNEDSEIVKGDSWTVDEGNTPVIQYCNSIKLWDSFKRMIEATGAKICWLLLPLYLSSSKTLHFP